MPIDILLHKHRDPAAAVLAALFLARFDPTSLPIAWLKNLVGILPDVADTHLLLAWARSVQESDTGDWHETIVGQLRAAAASRCVLFARTRYQLTRMTRIYGPKPRARQTKIVTPRRWRSGDYLDFAADAGGAEAFWGSTPFQPGPSAARRPRPGIGFTLESGRFREEETYPDFFEYALPVSSDYLASTTVAPPEAVPLQIAAAPDLAATFDFSFGLDITNREIAEDGPAPEFHIHLHFAPGERGSGVLFQTDLSSLEEDEASVAMIRASVEGALRTGIDERPVVDMVVTLDRLYLIYSAGFGDAFEAVIQHGLNQVSAERPYTPLERVAQLEITIAESFLGGLVAELNRRGGVILASSSRSGGEYIQTLVPYRTLEGFDTALREMSLGQGQYSQATAGYRAQTSDNAEIEAGGLTES